MQISAPETKFQKKLTRWSVYPAGLVIMIALIVLIGWAFDIEVLTRPIPHPVAMNPTSAIAFILSGLAFLLFSLKQNFTWKNLTGDVLSALVLLIGLLRFTGVVCGFDTHIDTLLFSPKLQEDVFEGISTRMAPITAVNFILTGTGLLLQKKDTLLYQKLTHAIALAIALLGLFSVLGYLYRVQAFYGVLRYIPIAIHTAICFLLLSAAFLLKKNGTGIMKDFTGQLAGSVTARLLIPAVTIVPILLGFFQLLWLRDGIFSVEFGVAILVLEIIIVFLAIIWYTAILLNKKDLLKQETEMALRQSEDQIQTIFNGAPDAVIVIDQEGKILKWNPKAETLFGWSKEEVIGKLLSETIIPDRYRGAHTKGLQRFLVTGEGPVLGKTIEIQATNKDNAEFDAALSISSTKMNDKFIFVGFIRDITAQKQAQIQLKESEEKYSLLFNSIDEGFCIIQMIFDEQKKPVDYRFLVINASFERQTGLQNAVGKRMREFAPNHEEHWFETYGRIAMTGESIRFENRAEQLHRWYDVYAFRLGEPKNLQVAILFNDITERKKTAKELESVNKELEAFSYSVSHDLRAPLRIINGYSKIVKEDYAGKLGEEGNRMLGIIAANALKMGHLIDDLLNFSRLGKKELSPRYFDMTGIVKSVIDEQQLPETNHTVIQVGNLEPAYCDTHLIEQVWINFISNAIKYSCQREKPVIEISSRKTAGEIIYSIKDNGVGFDMKYADKLFGVFQRLHSAKEFEGTGVGLALVQRIISRHGGRVWAEAEVNKGATFYFSLPTLLATSKN